MTQKIKLAVFDMDNCLIDDRHRQRLIEPSKPLSERYKRYHDAMFDDVPFKFGSALLRHLVDEGWNIVISTARPDKYRDQTIHQYHQMVGSLKGFYGAMMRDADEEGIPSAEMKVDKLSYFLGTEFDYSQPKPNFEIATFDDRPDVVSAYAQAFPGSHFLLTGDTLFSPKDQAPMAEASRIFHGLAQQNATSPSGKHICRVQFTENTSMFANISLSTCEFLRNIGLLFSITHWNSPISQSDFPGSEVYNERRKEPKPIMAKSTLLKSIGQEPIMPYCRCTKEPIIGFDPYSGDDRTAIHRMMFVDTPNSKKDWLRNQLGLISPEQDKPKTAADVLGAAAETFRERNSLYKDNASVVGEVMAVLFPDGVQLKTEADHKFYHLFELLVVKLTRFTNSGLTHEDSIHDLMIYAGMLEAIGVGSHAIKTDIEK